METVYVVERWGINQQGLVGVFTSEGGALEAADRARSYEHDKYHRFGIREVVLDTVLVGNENEYTELARWGEGDTPRMFQFLPSNKIWVDTTPAGCP
jgi:hypothetical protein